jgi:hypothetical protein
MQAVLKVFPDGTFSVDAPRGGTHKGKRVELPEPLRRKYKAEIEDQVSVKKL